MTHAEIDNAIAGLKALSAALNRVQTEPGPKRPRVVYKMAQNLQYGETIELDDGRGSGEIMGWGMNRGEVGVLLPGARLAFFDAKDRVRVVRD